MDCPHQVGSQADSAGSIPVHPLHREKRCNTSESDKVLQVEAATLCAAHVQLSCSHKTAMFALIGIRVTFFGGSGRARFEHPMSQR